jgi:hypothetical protein
MDLHRRAIPAIAGARRCLNLSGRTRSIGLNLMPRKKMAVGSQLLAFELPPTSLAVPRLSFRKGVFGVEEFLICGNRECRFLISLRGGNKLYRRAELILRVCPECNHEWSGRCPFCLQTLTVVWQNEVPRCSHYSRSLQPEAYLK